MTLGTRAGISILIPRKEETAFQNGGTERLGILKMKVPQPQGPIYGKNPGCPVPCGLPNLSATGLWREHQSEARSSCSSPPEGPPSCANPSTWEPGSQPRGLRSQVRAALTEQQREPAPRGPALPPARSPGFQVCKPPAAGRADGMLHGRSLAREKQSRVCSVTTRPTQPRPGCGTKPYPRTFVHSRTRHCPRSQGPAQGHPKTWLSARSHVQPAPPFSRPMLHPKGPAGPDSTPHRLNTRKLRRGRGGAGVPHWPRTLHHCPPPSCTQTGLPQGSLRNRKTDVGSQGTSTHSHR